VVAEGVSAGSTRAAGGKEREDPQGSLRSARFSLVIKPNVGGSGAGIVRFTMREKLADGTALVQEYIESEEGVIVRVEVLDGRYLYAIRIVRDRDANFNLCRRTSARRARSIGTSGGRGSRRLPAGRQAGARRPRLRGPRQGD